MNKFLGSRFRFRLKPHRWVRQRWRLCLISVLSLLIAGFLLPWAQAQTDEGIQQREDQLIREFVLPSPAPQAPVYRPQPPSRPAAQPAARPAAPRPAASANPPAARSEPRPEPIRQATETPDSPVENSSDEAIASAPESTGDTYDYVLEFNRDPNVGNGFHFKGLHATRQLSFTRPHSWNLKTAKALIRFQHSPALLADESYLSARINGTSIGSVPLNRPGSQVGQVLFNIPPNLIQDRNALELVVQQTDQPDCTEADYQALWTDVLPDSNITFQFEPQPIALDFSRYPYPVLDDLSLEPNQVTYVLPKAVHADWLTAASRLQASFGQLADFRGLTTRLANSIDDTDATERLVIIGTPVDQPAIADLKLPLPLKNNQWLDGNDNALPEDVGVLMLTTTADTGALTLVVTGNSAAGVTKAAQFLATAQTRPMAAGQYMTVNTLEEIAAPESRAWARALPLDPSFQLRDLKTEQGDLFQEVTVRGAGAPPIEFDFRALPDEQLKRGSTMTLRYSYSPQLNPRTSTVEVVLDGVALKGARLKNKSGADHQALKVDLPPESITPTSKMQVFFRLDPQQLDLCDRVADDSLWGTLHADTQFNLKREQVVSLPDLQLLTVGYPLAAPQDLSGVALVVPDQPSSTDLTTLLAMSERLGRVSQAPSIQLSAYTTSTLPASVRQQKHLVGIGTQSNFPFAELFQPEQGFRLQKLFSRQWNQTQVQALPDQEGLVKEVLSPWNGDRVLVGLSAQTEAGLQRVQHFIRQDPWFYRLKGDTVLIQSDQPNPVAYDPNAYSLEFLTQSTPQRFAQTGPLSWASRQIQDNWFLLPTGVILAAMMIYGISSLYLKQIGDSDPR